jgi:hypothetical protein
MIKLGDLTFKQLFLNRKKYGCEKCPIKNLGICTSHYEEPDCGPDSGWTFTGICDYLNEKKLKEDVTYGESKKVIRH